MLRREPALRIDYEVVTGKSAGVPVAHLTERVGKPKRDHSMSGKAR